VDGTPLAQAADRDPAVAQLVRFALARTAVGIVHADPDPEDVLVLPDGRLAILDFGAWCEVDRDRVVLATAAFDAFRERDVDAFARAVERLGWLPADRAPVALDVIERALGDALHDGRTT